MAVEFRAASHAGPRRGEWRERRAWWAPVAVTAAFAVCALVSLARPSFGGALGFSDHLTHMNAARLFPRVGTALWRTPVDQLVPPASAAEIARAPADVQAFGGIRTVPGWPADKPFVGTWVNLARPYPPGVFLLVAPVAALYHETALSFSAACHLLILVFLAGAHLAFYFAWRNAPDRGRLLYVAAALVAYVYVAFWTMRGFYDAAAVAPLIVCGAAFDRRRWLAVCAAFAIALFIHYRALFYAPWLLVAAWGLARDRAWRSWSRGDWAVVCGAVSLGALSLYTFALVTPTLGQVPLANPVHPGDLHAVPVIAFGASVALAAALFIRQASRLDLVMLVWMTLMLIAIRQLQAWHAFIFVPWVLAPAASNAVRAGRIQWAVIATVAVIL
jgi:hypothetical protein